MANTQHAFGSSLLEFGPCNLYWDTETGGDNLSLGGFDQVKVTMGTKKIELKEAQAGDRPADRAVSSQTVQITCGLSRATAERLAEIFQGFHLEKDTADVVTRIWLSDRMAQRDSSIVKQMTLKVIRAGAESTDPLDIIDFWKVAPMTESVELTFDAATQRFFGVVFECYKDDVQVDDEGKSTYFASREVV